MKNFSVISLGFLGLILLGAGCSFTASDDAVVPVAIIEEVEEVEVPVIVEERLVELHNNFIPGFYITYDDNQYTVARGPDDEPKEATANFVIVNSDDIWLFAEGENVLDRLLTMKYSKVDAPTNESVEARLAGIKSSTDMLFGDIDARKHELADGTTHYIILASTGYYELTVHDQALAGVAETLRF
ncbi:hypothetical protein HQ524_01460 [Candidatus Uhrbacteria bacterium]|nr:hypothetical protein [Candidatus Uhrbacteria bacterium]